MKDYMVYPGHGVGLVVEHTTKEILGKKHSFIVLEIIDSGMKILVPKVSLDAIGVRPIVSKEDANKVLDILNSPSKVDHSITWNMRYREYMELIKTGNIFDTAKVLRDLKALEVDKELSFGERKMIDTARNLIKTELNLVLGVNYENI
jgi:CarD family transcriptional regulator